MMEENIASCSIPNGDINGEERKKAEYGELHPGCHLGTRLHQSPDLNGKPAPKEVNGLQSSLAIACASACVIPTCKIQKYKKRQTKIQGIE